MFLRPHVRGRGREEKDLMRTMFGGMLAMLLVASTTGLAQQVYHAPKGPDGHPNFNGIWQVI